MGTKCEWCGAGDVLEEKGPVYWELPDGTRAITISDVPGIKCRGCGMHYQEEAVINEIEDQLMLIDTKELSDSTSFEELLKIPRFLKKNYFRF
ncbi:YokU family protein [Rossellomorea aquimaris]|uniref:YokU family protein n=1 Tax=Rossellomorea aquimaris TaxID=189382 RepID=UPI001CD35C76|nr:YokU family protein [Rossellomorea aquimaris]MCA1054528.1 YokU family protein [Rossellomorea aquimaris]